jgi:hypothetical protein
MEKKKKEFDTVDWVRSVREEHYRKWGHLPKEEYMRKLAEEAEQSQLAKKFKQKRSSR